jgi:hypothetical protein
MRGVCLIAYGIRANVEAQQCIASLRQHHSWPYVISSDVGGLGHVSLWQPDGYNDVQKSRWAKVTLDQWSPFDETLYLDADTRVQGDVSAGFDMLSDGFEMVMTPSQQQGQENMWHISHAEREYTYALYECGDVLQLQGGVFWFKRCAAIAELFFAWRVEWLKFTKFDQAALLRALRCAPVRLHLLGRPFNGGAVVAHRYGKAA